MVERAKALTLRCSSWQGTKIDHETLTVTQYITENILADWLDGV